MNDLITNTSPAVPQDLPVKELVRIADSIARYTYFHYPVLPETVQQVLRLAKKERQTLPFQQTELPIDSEEWVLDVDYLLAIQAGLEGKHHLPLELIEVLLLFSVGKIQHTRSYQLPV